MTLPETNWGIYTSHCQVRTLNTKTVHISDFADSQFAIAFPPGVKAGGDIFVACFAEDTTLGDTELALIQDILNCGNAAI